MDQNEIRVMIVDDHPVVRHGLRSLLEKQPDILVVGEAESGSQVIPMLEECAPDLLLLDIKMEGLDGVEVARRVRRSDPQIKLIILTTYNDEEYLHAALEAGVDGFLLKSVSHEILPDAIRKVMAGEKMLSEGLMTTVLTSYQAMAAEQARQLAGLRTKDLELLAAIAEGASTQVIAKRFYWSVATTKRRIQEVLEKLGASNRAQAIAEAVRRGWI